MQRSNANLLPHRDRTDRHLGPASPRLGESTRLTRKFDSGLCSKAVVTNVVIEAFRPQPHTDLDRRDVARVRQRFCDCDHPQLLVVADTHAKDINRTVLAVDTIVRRYQMLFDCSRVGDDLEHRTRFIDVANGTILKRFLRYAVEDVRIEGRTVGQRENFPSTWILYDDGACDGLGVGQPLLKFALGDVLNGTVDGEDEILPRIRLLLYPVVELSACINRDELPAGNALEIIIELKLQPSKTFPVQPDIA